MSGEKTEKATPRKRREARKKGQVRQSTEVNTAFCSIIMFGLLFLLWPTYTENLMRILRENLGPQAISQTMTGPNVNELADILTRSLMSMLNALFPILGAAMLAGIAINLIQVGFLFSTKSLGFKFSRISPLKGFKRMFSMNTIIELLKSLFKIAVLGYIAYSEYMRLLEGFPQFVGREIYPAFIEIMRTAIMVALKMCIAMVFLAAADFFYQWWKYEKDLKMTKQEVKDEYKMMEGDPKIKSKIRQKQFQMSLMRMMASVPEADVVITNPTHFAVALKYDEKVSKAPVVVAKGQDYVARKIKEVAIEHNVEIVENPPLAQSLYAMCEIDDEIPGELYQAVADILVFVYKQKGKIRT